MSFINIDDVRLKSFVAQGTTTVRLNGIVSVHGWMSHQKYSGAHDEIWKPLSALFKCLLTSSQIIKPLMYILESFSEPAVSSSGYAETPSLPLFDWFVISYPGLMFFTEKPFSVWNCKGCSDYNYPTLQPSQMKRVREVNGVSSVIWSLHLKPRLLQKQAVVITYIRLRVHSAIWENQLQRLWLQCDCSTNSPSQEVLCLVLSFGS